MTREIRKNLNEAKELYKNNKKEAFEIYEKCFLENPNELDYWDRVYYCWSMYHLFIKDFDDEGELMEYSERVTEVVKQVSLIRNPVCVYTQSVFRVLMYLKDNKDWEYMLYWLDKLNPDLLDETQGKSGDITYPSRKEEYFNLSSKAYFECGDYEDCIRVSTKALNTIEKFAFNGDVWHNWRIAKSYIGLGLHEDALVYLDKVHEVKQDWFVLKELALCYHELLDDDEALEYACDAVLTNDPAKIKINLYYLIYDILKDSDPELSLKHAKLFLALKLESGAKVPDEIEDLNIDESELDVTSLESEIKSYWSDYKFKDQELQYGTITKVFEHGKSGFIMSDDDRSHYFNSKEFKSDRSLMRLGQYVSFYSKKGFDKSKNRESLNAVNIRTGD